MTDSLLTNCCNSVCLLSGYWVVLDQEVPAFDRLIIEGTLEINNDLTKNFVLNVTYLYILGGRLIVGFENSPFEGQFSIFLRGDHSTPVFDVTEGPIVGSKVLGKSRLI